MFFSKEINRVISKGMSKHLLLRKTGVLKTCRKIKSLGKKIWRNVLALKSKKVQGIFGETFILALLSSTVLVYATVSQISFDLLCSGDKRLLSEFLRKWGWFQHGNMCFYISMISGT